MCNTAAMSEEKLKKPAVEEWLFEHGDYLYRYAMLRLRNEELARDMVQETMLAAWKASQGFRAESSVRTWLVGILKHKITDHIRKQIRDRRLMEHVESDPTSEYFDSQGHAQNSSKRWNSDPAKLVHDRQFLTTLSSCISTLSEQQKMVFTLRELNGEDTDTICNSCDISSTNMHVIMHRARLMLRKCLEKKWFGSEGGAA